MRTTGKLIIFIFTFLALAASTYAESPREQLRQMVEQLQKSPNDNALREQIIRLAQELKPAPAVPEEAERRMARGTAAFKGAKSIAAYRDAAKEFEQATLAAPWYGDAYLNLGVAQDKAENYEAALRSLKLALLALPNDKEIKALIYEVEYRNERASSPEAQEAKRKQQEQETRRAEEEMIRSLEGAIFVQNMDESTGAEEWKRIWKDSNFLRIRGGSVEKVDRETGSAIKLGDGRRHYLCNGNEFAPIGTEKVCHRSSPFIGRIAQNPHMCPNCPYEISTDGRVIMDYTSTVDFNGRVILEITGNAVKPSRFERQ